MTRALLVTVVLLAQGCAHVVVSKKEAERLNDAEWTIVSEPNASDATDEGDERD